MAKKKDLMSYLTENVTLEKKDIAEYHDNPKEGFNTLEELGCEEMGDLDSIEFSREMDLAYLWGRKEAFENVQAWLFKEENWKVEK